MMFSATVMSGMTEISCGRNRTPAATASRGSAKTTSRAVDRDRAGVARVDAGEDLHQRRLAGAIRAEERHDLARRDDEIDIGEHRHAAERFADAAHLEARAGMRGSPVSTARHGDRGRNGRASPSGPDSVARGTR